ncbi:MAG: ComF family protein [Vicingaceae bacterium]
MALTWLEFEKSSLTQKIIHELKYQKNPGIGLLLGRIIGQRFKILLKAEGVDLIVPVPLHWKRKVHRTYNQAETIAKGISRESDICYSGKFLKRIRQTPTQTTLNRHQRWLNMEEVFRVGHKSEAPKHVLLVDDVITTGATMESCINAISKKVDCDFSVLSLARST